MSQSRWSFFPAMPATRIAMLRILVGAYGLIYLLARLPHLFSYALDDLDRFVPVGIVAFAETPMLPALYQVVVLATVALSAAFFVGWRYRVTAPLYALSLLFVLTHSNSWGKILHTDNMLVMFVIVLAAGPAADALSWDARRAPSDLAAREAEGRYGWQVRLMATICVLVYLLAGIAKLRNSGLDFANGVTLRNYVGFDNVRKLELGSIHSPIGAALLPYGWFFGLLALGSLVLELVGPAAILHRRFGKLWAIGVWLFHIGVLALMAIAFLFQITGVAFAPFFDVEKLAERPRVAALLRWLRLAPAQAGSGKSGGGS